MKTKGEELVQLLKDSRQRDIRIAERVRDAAVKVAYEYFGDECFCPVRIEKLDLEKIIEGVDHETD